MAVRAWREGMDQHAPDGMEAVVAVKLRSGVELIPVRVQDVGDGWVGFETFADDQAKIEVVAVQEREIAEVRCRFEPKAKQPLGFTVGEISGATG
jgi:hypothetical protein